MQPITVYAACIILLTINEYAYIHKNIKYTYICAYMYTNSHSRAGQSIHCVPAVYIQSLMDTSKLTAHRWPKQNYGNTYMIRQKLVVMGEMCKEEDDAAGLRGK